ncbi:hypothetical protein EX30DRAFT_363885 [Ascodesmis nigricans]|uniref:Uncharacterized protein n=1 Tax=Ascodesmis nigricans TaxID=341454 RepID=A0A4S2MWX9_9PEZI|nr:hypothetical protein EX30DRAFT_363885 [Ascodesmis nigricans]
MSENSNPFRRPHSARAAPTTPVDETLFDSILGLQGHRESVHQTSPKASGVGSEGGVADRKPQTKPRPPPPPAPRRRGTQKINPAIINLASSHVGESSHASLPSPSPSSPTLPGPHSVEFRPSTSRHAAVNNPPDITNRPSTRSSGDTTGEFAAGLTRPGTALSLDATSELTTPRSSYDLGSRPLEPPASLERKSSARIKPPPPKPRTRSGGHITQTPGNVSSATSQQESVSTESAPSLVLSDQTASIVGPELATAPKDASIEIEKRVPPPPPLSRRVSVRVSVAPVQKRRPKSMLPPPPPPIRKASGSINRMSWHGNGPRSDVTSPGSLPLAPTYPQGNHQGPASPLHDGNVEVEVAPLGEDSRGNVDNGMEGNILVDLEALKREVEELRGKYDAKSAPAEP